jgi:hypothetical protein
MIEAHAGQLPAVAMSLSNWALTSVYVGLEMEASSAADPNAGQISDSFHRANIAIITDQSQTYDPANPPASSGLAQNIFTDTTIGVSGQVQGSVYDGPDAGLVSQYIYPGSDSMCFIAPPRSYIGGGPGQDAIMATGGGNVIDGGGGSNYLIGETDNSSPDIFFEDGFNEAPGQTTWDTITNFHGGDLLIIWAYDPVAWSLKWLPDAGAEGATGLTLYAQNNTNGAAVYAAFSGLTAADQPSMAVGNGTSAGGNPHMYFYRTSSPL